MIEGERRSCTVEQRDSPAQIGKPALPETDVKVKVIRREVDGVLIEHAAVRPGSSR